MASSVGEKFPCEEERILPADQEIIVIVNHVDDDGSLWVMLKSEVESLSMLSRELTNLEPPKAPIAAAILNQVYAVLHTDETWYRAVVICTTPETIVQFIDFGDLSAVSLNNIAPLPPTLHAFPRLAMKITIPPDSSVRPMVGDAFKVKYVCKRDDAVVVDIVNEFEEASALSNACFNPASTESNDNLCISGVESSSDKQAFEVGCFTSKTVDKFNTPSLYERITGSSHSRNAETICSPVREIEVSSNSESNNLLCSEDFQDVSHVLVQNTEENSSSAQKVDVSEQKDEFLNNFSEAAVFICEESIDQSINNELRQMPAVLVDVTAPNTTHIGGAKNEDLDEDCIVVKEFVSETTVDLVEDKKQDCSKVKDNLIGIYFAEEEEIKKYGDVQSHTALTTDLGCEKTDNVDTYKNEAFISALGRYPHLGGGYGPGLSDDSLAHNVSYSKNKPADSASCSSFMAQDASSGPTSSAYTSKNRYQSGNKPFRSNMPNSNFRPNNQKNTNFQSVGPSKSYQHQTDASMDFKSVLDFELSIIREQNRLQLLQIQKKMDEQYQLLTKQINAQRDDMARQLSVFRNEVNSKLFIMNDTLIQKIAQFHTDFDLLKNEMEIKNTDSSLNNYKPSSQLTTPQTKGYKGTQPHNQFPLAQEMKLGTSDHVPFTENPPWSNQQDQTSHEASFPANTLMSIRKEKMAEREQQKALNHQYQQPTNDTEQNGKNYVLNQTSLGYPKMDHFDPLKTANEPESQSNKNGCIVHVCELDPEKIKPDILFNLFGVYGNVQRIKIKNQDKGKAFIEMADPAQAEAVVKQLDGVPFMNKRLRVMPCSFSQLKLSRFEFQANTCKDYSKPNSQKLHRFFIPGSWNSSKLCSPNEEIVVSNILRSVSEDKIREVFAKNGFHFQSIWFQNYSTKEEEKKRAFILFGSLAEAVDALAVMHLKELSDWMTMKISFGKGDKKYSEV